MNTNAERKWNIAVAIARLKVARDHLQMAGCPQATKAVRAALKSADGARRHADRMARQKDDVVRHTSCARCGLDIEGIARGDWRDRGNNTKCSDTEELHVPTPEQS